MEGVERAGAGDRQPEAAAVAVVDQFDRDFVRPSVPEEGDLEAVLLAVRELFQAGVHGEFLPGRWPAFHGPDHASQAMPLAPGRSPLRSRIFLAVGSARIRRPRAPAPPGQAGAAASVWPASAAARCRRELM